jgi:DNA-binding response OmpR family regulator
MKKKLRILHVDDEIDTLKVVKIILEKAGYDVVSVEGGKAALAKINLNGFSLLILDVMMPDMSGWDLFSRIATIKPDYKVIFLSVLEATKEKIKQLKDHGVKDYITKPFDRNDLVARVKKAIES